MHDFFRASSIISKCIRLDMIHLSGKKLYVNEDYFSEPIWLPWTSQMVKQKLQKEQRTSCLWQPNKLAPKLPFTCSGMLLECSMSGYPITRNHPRDGYGEHQTHGDDLGAAAATQAELLTGEWVTTCMFHTAIHWWSVCWTWLSSGGYESTSHLAISYALVHWCSQQEETFKPKWHKAPAEDGSPFIFTRSTSIPPNKFLDAPYNLSFFSPQD